MKKSHVYGCGIYWHCAFAKYSSLETMTIPDNVEEYYGSAEVETQMAVVAFGEDISQSA